MDIKEYLVKEEKTQSWLARKAGISRQLLSYHIRNPHEGWHKKNATKVVVAIYGEPIREKIISLVMGEI